MATSVLYRSKDEVKQDRSEAAGSDGVSGCEPAKPFDPKAT